jgi:hypothetical protein
LGKVEEYELKENGKQIKVTEENKEEFLRFEISFILLIFYSDTLSVVLLPA